MSRPIFRGHRIVATDPHLNLPVIALGQGDQVGIGILALGNLCLHLLTPGLGGQLHGLLGLEQGVLEHVVKPGIGTLQNPVPGVLRSRHWRPRSSRSSYCPTPVRMSFSVLVTAATGSNLPQLYPRPTEPNLPGRQTPLKGWPVRRRVPPADLM